MNLSIEYFRDSNYDTNGDKGSTPTHLPSYDCVTSVIVDP